MKRKKITQRDPFGREQSSYEEERTTALARSTAAPDF